MSTYQRRARQSAAQRDLSTGRDSFSDGTIRSEQIIRKDPRIAQANKTQGRNSINDNGRPTSMGRNAAGQKVPIASPNLRRESIEIKKAASRKKK